MKISFAKLYGVLCTSCVLFPFPSLAQYRPFNPPGQQPDPVAEAANREYMRNLREAYDEQNRVQQNQFAITEAQRREYAIFKAKVKPVEDILAKVGPDAYRKFSDGTVASLELLLWIKYRLTSLADCKYRYVDKVVLVENFTVKETTGDGCRIAALERNLLQGQEEEWFVDGLRISNDHPQPLILILSKHGNCNYTTIKGARRKILKFELGERATKEEYEEFCRKLTPISPTPAPRSAPRGSYRPQEENQAPAVSTASEAFRRRYGLAPAPNAPPSGNSQSPSDAFNARYGRASTPAPSPNMSAVGQRKASSRIFRGMLSAVNKLDGTFQVGQNTYQITAETRVTKGGRPATLDDAAVGDTVSGVAKPDEDGRTVASSLRLSLNSP